MRVLSQESSCDETSIAIIEDGKILANTIYSQLEHSQYGGVVPEIASRAHLEKLIVLPVQFSRKRLKSTTDGSYCGYRQPCSQEHSWWELVLH